MHIKKLEKTAVSTVFSNFFFELISSKLYFVMWSRGGSKNQRTYADCDSRPTAHIRPRWEPSISVHAPLATLWHRRRFFICFLQPAYMRRLRRQISTGCWSYTDYYVYILTFSSVLHGPLRGCLLPRSRITDGKSPDIRCEPKGEPLFTCGSRRFVSVPPE